MSEHFPFSRVLVTGGAGFLGRFVVERLRDYRDVEIFVPRQEQYDLVQLPDIQRLLDDTQPDLIIHLAALVGGIGANQQQPGKFFYDNLMMGVQLIEHARLHGVKKFVALGTVCAYPKFTQTPFKEEDLWNGYPEETNAPYALAKKMMLVQSESYRAQYGFNSIFLLPANLYGPGDNFDLQTSHVIPALIRKCVEARDAGRPFIEAWGTGQASREFLYVGDCAEGVVRAAIAYDESDPVNLGTGTEIQIGDLARLIARLTDYHGDIHWQHERPDGQPKRRLDVSRALEKFGFRANMQLEEGLKRTIEWYEENRAGRASQPAAKEEMTKSLNV